MLTATNITYRIGQKPLISDITASFAPGKLHLIIGPNGAGKSTLIKVLARLLRPQGGKVEYGGLDVSDAGEADLARHRAVLFASDRSCFSSIRARGRDDGSLSALWRPTRPVG